MNGKLEELASILRPLSLTVEMRGSGRAQFLYVTGNSKAVEISIHDTGTFWVEYWESSDEGSDDPAVLERTIASTMGVTESVREWFFE